MTPEICENAIKVWQLSSEENIGSTLIALSLFYGHFAGSARCLRSHLARHTCKVRGSAIRCRAARRYGHLRFSAELVSFLLATWGAKRCAYVVDLHKVS